MGFRDLKETFASVDLKKTDQEQFRFLYLRALFELNGNLDTIALCARASVEQFERTRVAVERLVEIQEGALRKLDKHLDFLEQHSAEKRAPKK